jgi:sarcosine oxidase
VPEHFSGLYEPEAGLVLCERAIAGCAELALRGGAELHAHERVQAWWPDGDGVAVRTERGTYRAGRLVLAAGAWAEQLVGELGVALRVTRQAVGWVWPSVPEPFELGRFPCWAIQHDAPGFEGIYYGFPLLPAARFAGERGIKVGHHALGANVDPDRVDRTPSAADEADFRPALERYLPEANGPTLALRVCLYTMSPDRHFIVDRHPRHPQIVLACGFSGHGFKFAAVLGEALADLALEGKSALPIGFLSLARFGAG